MCSLFSFHHSVSNVLILGFFDCTKMTSAWNPVLTSSFPCSLFPQNYSCTFLYFVHASVHLESCRKWSWLSALAIKWVSYILFYLPFKIYGLEYDTFDYCCCYLIFMFIFSVPKCVYPEIMFFPWVTPISAQKLFLPLHSGLTPNNSLEIIWDVEVWVHVGYLQDKCPILCTITVDQYLYSN